MRFVHIGLVVFTALAVLLEFRNLETATVSFLSAGVALPVSLLVFAFGVPAMPAGARRLVPAGSRDRAADPPA